MKITFKYIYSLVGAVAFFSLVSCYEDKGNYSYSEKEAIEISLPDGVTAMSQTEYLKFSPKIVSSLSGEITADNANYEFDCKIRYTHKNLETGATEYWLNMNPDNQKDINFLANIPASTYPICYSVMNKATGVTTSVKGTVKVLSSTFEGWMVLSNVGTDNTAQLSMISKNSKGELVVIKNVLGDEVSPIKDATAVVMNPDKMNNAESVFLMSHSEAYRLDIETLQALESNNLKLTDFMLPTTPGSPVSMLVINAGGVSAPISRLCVTDLGNAYAITANVAGSSFEDLMNTNAVGAEQIFKVSPMTGTSMERPGNTKCALLYDDTNKRFVGWSYEAQENRLLFDLNDPADGKLFSFQTGMTLVDMESTRFSAGLVYSVLQDDQNKRHVYGINLSESKFVQESIYEDITAEHFNDATDYAFHSQYPFMFYSYGNKVYFYNLGTGAAREVIVLDAGETVTKLKFNLYVNMRLTDLNDQSDEFMAKQFQLIVGSTTSEENGGAVRFYSISATGEVKQVDEYKGFGKVVDVTYRERR